jgi:hypothetical protein
MKVLIVGTIHCGHHGKAPRKEIDDYNHYINAKIVGGMAIRM